MRQCISTDQRHQHSQREQRHLAEKRSRYGPKLLGSFGDTKGVEHINLVVETYQISNPADRFDTCATK
jgi:hypothetical protein